jgi:hypothetical protein
MLEQFDSGAGLKMIAHRDEANAAKSCGVDQRNKPVATMKSIPQRIQELQIQHSTKPIRPREPAWRKRWD